MKSKRKLLVRLIAFLAVIGIAAWMFVIGRGHTIYFDNKPLEADGQTYESPYQIQVLVDGESIGKLKEGELKFTCDKSTDWYGAWFMADAAGKAPTGEEESIIFLDKSRAETATMGIKELDQKWNIPAAGTYEITLDQVNETIIIKKK